LHATAIPAPQEAWHDELGSELPVPVGRVTQQTAVLPSAPAQSSPPQPMKPPIIEEQSEGERQEPVTLAASLGTMQQLVGPAGHVAGQFATAGALQFALESSPESAVESSPASPVVVPSRLPLSPTLTLLPGLLPLLHAVTATADATPAAQK
jgi:hypothetical protein